MEKTISGYLCLAFARIRQASSKRSQLETQLRRRPPNLLLIEFFFEKALIRSTTPVYSRVDPPQLTH
jgi:hypothetical protein